MQDRLQKAFTLLANHPSPENISLGIIFTSLNGLNPRDAPSAQELHSTIAECIYSIRRSTSISTEWYEYSDSDRQGLGKFVSDAIVRHGSTPRNETTPDGKRHGEDYHKIG